MGRMGLMVDDPRFGWPWCRTSVADAPVKADDAPPLPWSVVVPVAAAGAGSDPPPTDDVVPGAGSDPPPADGIGLAGGWTGPGGFGM